MKVTFRDHDGKGARLAAALADAGHEIVQHSGEVALVDCDAPIDPYRGVCDNHERVMVYPHGGGNPFCDGHWPIHPHTVCRFVPGPGQADVLQRCGYPGRVETIGWPMCDRLPFRPTDQPVNVLFAPQHPLGDGWMSEGMVEANARIHDLLASLPISLTVRYVPIGSAGLEQMGIHRRPGVDYRQAPMVVNDGEAAIDGSDLVVAAEGTFPSLAVARGCPTVMYAQIPADNHITGEPGTHTENNWHLYRDAARFPLDADDITTPDDMMDLLLTAGRDEPVEWRDRFIGPQFDPELFVKTFEDVA